MATMTKADRVEELKKLGLKWLGNQLEVLAEDLLALLSKADSEAHRLPKEQQTPWVMAFAPKAIARIRDYRIKLMRSMQDGDPKNLEWASGLFSDLSRYFGDAKGDYVWFSRDADLDNTLMRMYDIAAAIITSIKVFDPASLESARKALM